MRARGVAPLLVLGLVRSGRGCANEELLVNGHRTTCAASGLDCAAWFCPECAYAGACDAFCGYCEPCAVEGGLRDCAGRCVGPRECLLGELGLEACGDWLGNGCCDDGAGYTSDAGLALDFNCAAHGFDGGDCERAPSPRDGPTWTWAEAVDHGDWCIVLTRMTHTVRRDAALRRGDYVTALAKWFGPTGTSRPVVVVENSGANLSALRAVAPGAEFVSWRDGDASAVWRGKGHGEYRALREALTTSRVLTRKNQGCARVAKVTGRYFVHGLDAALATVAVDAALAVQSTPSPWTLWDGVLRSEVIGFRNDIDFLDALFGDQDESAGRPLERALYVGAQGLLRDGRVVASLPPLHVDATLNAEESTVVTEL